MIEPEVQTIPNQVLFVDDGARVLDAIRRMLHGEFRIETASSSTAGIVCIHLLGPFAVVISDMHGCAATRTVPDVGVRRR
jgi:PleD family two-component response regulator